VTLMVLEKVEALAHYDRELRSSRWSVPLPAVVRLQRRVPWRRPTVSFSRKHVFCRDGHSCQYCGQAMSASELTFDHVVPRCQGGGTHWTNIVTCCRLCNQLKGDRTPAEASMELLRQPFVPYWVNKGSELATEARSLWEPYLW
jgi:5-methylcytosine-specific restriction endonuclease McrA